MDKDAHINKQEDKIRRVLLTEESTKEMPVEQSKNLVSWVAGGRKRGEWRKEKTPWAS